MGATVGFVFARGGSKGVRNKNVRQVAGRPLVAHAVATAVATPGIERVVVSTDDAGIAAAAETAGAEVPFMRPAELATDDAAEWAAWRHAVRWLRERDGREAVQTFVSVPPTSPVRTSADVQRCIDRLAEEDADIVITVTPARRNPYFNMVTLDDGYARLMLEPQDPIRRRQDAPAVYDITTVAYAARADYILEADGLFDGRVAAVVLREDRALDIDTEVDLALADLLLTSGWPDAGPGGPAREDS